MDSRAFHMEKAVFLEKQQISFPGKTLVGVFKPAKTELLFRQGRLTVQADASVRWKVEKNDANFCEGLLRLVGLRLGLPAPGGKHEKRLAPRSPGGQRPFALKQIL